MPLALKAYLKALAHVSFSNKMGDDRPFAHGIVI